MTDKSQTELVKIALFSCQELIAALEELGWMNYCMRLDELYLRLRKLASNLGILLSSPLPPPED